jgi:hypothetical protein
VCGFRGRAIYLDVDIIVDGDIGELWDLAMDEDVSMLAASEPSVMVIECDGFEAAWWPRLGELRESERTIAEYLQLVTRRLRVRPLPVEWNCLDGHGFMPGETRAVHFTEMETQPWRPYLDQIAYRAHPVAAAEALLFRYAHLACSGEGQALAAEALETARTRGSKCMT